MQTWKIDFEGLDGTRKLRSAIEERIAELSPVDGTIEICVVVVRHPQTGKRKGLYELEIGLTLTSGRDLKIGRSRSADKRYEEIDFAIDDTFRRARRRLKEVLRNSAGNDKKAKKSKKRRKAALVEVIESEPLPPVTDHSAEQAPTVAEAAAPEPAPVEAEPEPAPVEAVADPAPVEAAAEPAPVEAEPEPAPVEAEAEPVPAEAEPEPAPVEAEPEPAPVEAAAEPVPVEAEPEPAPVEAEPEPAPVEAATEPAPVEAEPEPAPAEAAAEAAQSAKPSQATNFSPFFVAMAVGTALTAAATLNASAAWARLLKDVGKSKCKPEGCGSDETQPADSSRPGKGD